MMNCVSAAKASTYVHKHPLVHSLNANAFWPQLQTRVLIFAACTRSGNATGDPPKKRGKKRSPASPASENGANRSNKYSKRKSTATRPNAQATERHFFWVTHGQTSAGFVEQVDETYKALGADERELGTFDSLKAAADAVSASFGRAA
jgi:hypothetical protein